MIFSDEYYKKHQKRFNEIELLLDSIEYKGRFLELGATEKFQVLERFRPDPIQVGIPKSASF